MAFRTQDTQDFGIDAHAELVEEDVATGRLLAIQVKSGPSYLKRESEAGFSFPFDSEHHTYWINHALPVIVVLCDVERERLYWQRVASDTSENTGRGWKVTVPRLQLLDNSSIDRLRDAATLVAAPRSYSIVRQEDVSYAHAKRYSVKILLNRTLTKAEIAAVIRSVTQAQMGSRYHRNHLVEGRWGDVDAHVVWTYVYASFDDFKHSNAICRSWWIDSSLPAKVRPITSVGENIGLSISMAWSGYHRQLAELLADQEEPKSRYLTKVDRSVADLQTKIVGLASVVGEKGTTTLDQDEVEKILVAVAPSIARLSSVLEDIGPAPLECRDLDSSVQALAAAAHNTILPYLELGRDRWAWPDNINLTRSYIQTFSEETARFGFEREKV